jgi:hypothetical protein
MMNEVSKPTPQMSFFRRWANEIVSGVVVTIIVAGLAAVWPTLLAWAFPDYVSGNYLLLGPEEKPSHGPDVINVQLSSYNGHVWGSMSQSPKRWSIVGYWNNNYLIFSYRSDGNGPDSIGFGEQFLTPVQAGKDSILVGDVRGNYCLDEAVDQKPQLLRCPSVLVRAEPQAANEWATKYASYLGAIKQRCQPVDIPIAMTAAKAELKCPPPKK